jgi:hypothetical protein
MMQTWAATELRHANLGDKRLNRRLVRVVETLSAQPTASVPQACGNWTDTKAVYRFWDDDQVTPEAILDSHSRSSIERLATQACVLLIQDSTELDFAHHPATEGLGRLEHPAQYGMKVHSVLGASTEGVPLGLVHQAVWVREAAATGERQRRRQRATADKESQRWLTGLEISQRKIPAAVEIITVADSEADIFDLFALPRRPGSHVLIRATHNRRVDEVGYLWDTVRQSPVRGGYTLALRRKEDMPARQAKMGVRYVSVTLQPPRHHLSRSTLVPLQLQVILAEEEDAPAGTKPVCWLLLTSLPIDSLEDALCYVRWYSYRWLIERYHFTLKSGCRLEDLQLEHAARIQRALATYLVVAWRLLWLTYQARRQPDQPCSDVLETHEWQALYCTIHQTPVPPSVPPTLRQAVHWIARLGGFLDRRSDGEPGVKTIWLGLRRLSDIAATWQLCHSHSNPSPACTTYG